MKKNKVSPSQTASIEGGSGVDDFTDGGSPTAGLRELSSSINSFAIREYVT